MNTTYFLNLVSGNVFKTAVSPGIPTNYYIGLSTTTPTAAGTGVTEPSTSAGYSRVALTSLSAPNNGVVTNTSLISFNESTSSWGTVTYFVIYDSSTVGSGNLLMYGALTTPRVVEAATTLSIRNGYLQLSVINPS